MEKQIAVHALSALAHETRLDVFRLLVQAGPDGLAAGEVGDSLELAPATLSFHLKELTTAGLLEVERVGRMRIYRPAYEAMNRLLSYLTENCCQGVARPRRRRSR